MAIFGCSQDEVRQFIDETAKVRARLNDDEKFLRQVLEHQDEYTMIRDYFSHFLKFLQYPKEVNVKSLYRVRKRGESDNPFIHANDLSYPPPSTEHENRMNNTAFPVLYTSFHEYTAMAETRIDTNDIGKHFQLTRFTVDKPIKVYELGLFSELYFNSPRDSEFVITKMLSLFNEPGHDTTVSRYSALECAIAGILYDISDKYHVLSSILADAIFAINDEVEAIMYPSLQNRYGVNFAINKNLADKMQITYTCLNILIDVYENGFYKYNTIKECTSIYDAEELNYSEISHIACYR